MSSICCLHDFLLEGAHQSGVSLIDSGLRVAPLSSPFQLTSDICISLAKKLRVAPERMSETFLRLPWKEHDIVLKSERGYLNFFLRSAERFDWEQMPPLSSESTQLALFLDGGIRNAHHEIRILSCACLHIYLLQKINRSFTLQLNGDIHEGASVDPFSLFRMFLSENNSATAGERALEILQKGGKENEQMVLWTHPDRVENYFRLQGEVARRSHMLFPLKLVGRSQWTETVVQEHFFSKLQDWDNATLLSLWVYFSTSFAGSEIFLDTIEFRESGNVSWLLASTVRRLTRVLSSVVVDEGPQDLFSSQCLYWLLECAVRYGEVVQLFGFLVEILNSLMSALSHPSFRQSIEQDGPEASSQLKSLSQALRVLMEFQQRTGVGVQQC